VRCMLGIWIWRRRKMEAMMGEMAEMIEMV
jgi:hypothetical protein